MARPKPHPDYLPRAQIALPATQATVGAAPRNANLLVGTIQTAVGLLAPQVFVSNFCFSLLRS